MWTQTCLAERQKCLGDGDVLFVNHGATQLVRVRVNTGSIYHNTSTGLLWGVYGTDWEVAVYTL